ncbi:MAG TPA: MFS transporter [Rhodopila sp.]|jgi:MFS family permease|nr:MFS transporter [Rhodopila sp.]
MQYKPLIILVSLALARIAFGYQFQTIASLTAELMAKFHLTYSQLGTLIGSYMMCGAVAALPLGLFGRRWGEGRILAIGLVLMTGGSWASAMASTMSGVGVGRAVAGFGAVAMIVLQNKIIAEWFTGRAFVMAISVTVCAFPVGMGLAGLVLPAMNELLGLQAALLTDVVPAGLSLILFVFSYSEPVGAPSGRRRFSLPTGAECILLAAGGITWMAYTAGFSGFVSYLPVALSLRGYGAPLIGAVMAIAMWGNVVGTLAGGGIAARAGALNVFLFGTVALVVGMFGLMLTAQPIACAFVFGILGSIQPGIVMAASTLSAKPENRAVGMGLFYTIYYVGGSAAPTLCGFAADYAGRPEGGLLAGAVFSALAIPAFMVHRALTRRGLTLIGA